jgi:hypothetical protein
MVEWQGLPFGLEANLQLDCGGLSNNFLKAAY